ncbi:unnamed protein product [marine sediment metagenome]|uniref:Uncharacterized protein n=1 Tax=marine sediment metagenome TaxID=412755 RepID=X0YJ22_9ZZZZ
MSNREKIRYILRRFAPDIARQILKLVNEYHKNVIRKDCNLLVAKIIKGIEDSFRIKENEITGILMCHGITIILSTQLAEKNLIQEKISCLYALIKDIENKYNISIDLNLQEAFEILKTVSNMSKNEMYKLFEPQILDLKRDVVKIVNDGKKIQKYSMNKIENILKDFLSDTKNVSEDKSLLKDFFNSLTIKLNPDDYIDYFIIYRFRKVLNEDYGIYIQINESQSEDKVLSIKERELFNTNKGILIKTYITTKLNLYFKERPTKKKLRKFKERLLIEAKNWSSEEKEFANKYIEDLMNEWKKLYPEWKKWSKKMLSVVKAVNTLA